MLLVGIIIATRPEIWRAGFARFVRRPERRDWAFMAVWSFAAFSAWLLISGLWSEVNRPWKVWSDFTFTVLAAGALVYQITHNTDNARAVKRIAGAFLFAAAAAVALLAFEAVSRGALRAAISADDTAYARVKDQIALARGLTAVIPSLFAAAAVALLWRRKLDLKLRLGIGAVFAGAALAAALNSVTANTLALFFGAAAYLAASFMPRAVLRGLGVLVAVMMLIAPLAAYIPAARIAAGAPIETSWSQRLFTFKKGGEAAIACAPFGCGADFGRALSRQQEKIVAPGPAKGLSVMPLHPHNVFLQVWMDLGAPGAFAFAAAAVFGFFALARLEGPRVFFAAAAAVSASVLVSALIEASLWQNWRIAAVGFAAAGLALAWSFHNLHLKSGAEADTSDP